MTRAKRDFLQWFTNSTTLVVLLALLLWTVGALESPFGVVH